MNRRISFVLVALALAAPLSGEPPRLRAVGWRFGAFRTGQDNNFVQLEAFASWNLPWDRKLRNGWNARSTLELSGGSIQNMDSEGTFVAFGPGVVLYRGTSPWSFDFGVRPTWISRYEFAPDNFGGPFQFTSHVGVWRDFGSFEVGYRFHHMSNARIFEENDGINFHFLQVSRTF